ncbi:MAG: type II toxin-antitoxin system VapC family toxin [Acidobacteriota bacterium]
MKRIVVDASALGAVVFGEPHAHIVRAQLEQATVFAPALLKFELANIAWKKANRQPANAATIIRSLALALEPRWNIVWQDVEAADVVLMARASGLTAYDASYLWLAGALGADLVTLDRRLAEAHDAFASSPQPIAPESSPAERDTT